MIRAPLPSDTRDLELDQCHVRLALNLAIALWYLAWLHFRPYAAAMGLEIAAGYFAFALTHWFIVKRYPGSYFWRRLVVIFADQGVCTLWMMLAGELGTIVVFATAWISVGNGIRFGVRWMIVSSTLAIAGLIVLGVTSPYWSQHPILILSLVLLNLAIPAYVTSLLSGLEAARAKLANHAREMEQMALKDNLTGLANRAALIEELQRSCHSAQRETTSLALLYFDLDGFKDVNDTYGHPLGDALLREMAVRVKALLRAEDLFARLGGDEFVIVLKIHDPAERIALVAERVRQAVASINALEGKPIAVSASIGGITVLGAEAAVLGAEQLIHEADRNMYLAKKNGKNQSVLTEWTGRVETLLPA